MVTLYLYCLQTMYIYDMCGGSMFTPNTGLPMSLRLSSILSGERAHLKFMAAAISFRPSLSLFLSLSLSLSLSTQWDLWEIQTGPAAAHAPYEIGILNSQQ